MNTNDKWLMLGDNTDILVINRFTDKRDEDNPVKRNPGEILFNVPLKFAKKLVAKKVAEIIDEGKDYPWSTLEGRELCPLDMPGNWKRIVACLNIWQDLDAIKETLPTWYEHVDHVIAVDGAYKGALTDKPYSTDGTVEYLKRLDKVEVVETNEFWDTQYEKRTEYFKRGGPGDLMFVVDADEYVEHAERLKDLPDFDVGWALCNNTLYDRDQTLSRLYKWTPGLKYQGRHYWVFNNNGLVANRQTGGHGLDHRLVPIIYRNLGNKAPRSYERNINRKATKKYQRKYEEKVGDESPKGRESLRILNVSNIDPGCVIYRLHSAINTTSPHTSIMATKDLDKYLEIPFQFNIRKDRDIIRSAAAEADVIHCHVNYYPFFSLGVDTDAKIIMHHHGTAYRKDPEGNRKLDKRRADLVFVSNLELLQYSDNTIFLPNPVPVARYEKLKTPARSISIRIGHSPTKRHKKGTKVFLEVMEKIREEGYDVETVLIENMPHKQCLEMKGTCDIFFDSFDLGIQCSGLEAAAMKLPVVAGDAHVSQQYQDRFGYTPYVFANDEKTLYNQLIKLIEDDKFYNHMSNVCYNYVLRNHDYPVVTKKYLDILNDRFGWKEEKLL